MREPDDQKEEQLLSGGWGDQVAMEQPQGWESDLQVHDGLPAMGWRNQVMMPDGTMAYVDQDQKASAVSSGAHDQKNDSKSSVCCKCLFIFDSKSRS